MIIEKGHKFLFLILLVLLPSLVLAQGGKKKYKTFYYDNGQMSSEGFMVDGKPDGLWKTYFENGQLKTIGIRTEFELDSTWVFYREDGVKEQSINYQKGKKSGTELIYNEKGNVVEKFEYIQGKKEGEGLYFYNSGDVYKIINFVADKEQGLAFEYDEEDGRVITKLKYDKGYLRSIEKVNRYDSQKRRKGYWEDKWPNSNLKEEGNWTEDKRNGIFKLYDKQGRLEELATYRNGVRVTEEEQSAVILNIKKEYFSDGKVKMIGGYDGDSKQGVFREYDENGNIINSVIYQNNQKIGEGIVDKEGNKQGPWILFYPSGEIMAKGEFVDNEKHKNWDYFYLSGDKRQTGSYRNGKPDGEWTWYHENGLVHREEIYRRGYEDGLMVEYDTLGNIIHTGEYIDGLKMGEWYYYVNDHKEEGEYVEDEKNGVWKHFYDNGKKSFQGEFLGGVPIGRHQWYYPTGIKKEEGKFAAGVKEGEWKKYDETGMVSNVLKYELGIVVRVNGEKVKTE